MQKVDLRFLVVRSLDLDRKTLLRARWIPLRRRFALVLKKYVLLIKHVFTPFRLGESHIYLGSSPLFYDSRVGTVAGYQAVLIEHMSWLGDLSTPSEPLVLDVGANIGYVTKAITERYADARIIAFEPSVASTRVMLKNCLGSEIVTESAGAPEVGQVHILNVAVNSTGAPMVLDERSSESALSRTREVGDEQGEEVPGKTLDEVTGAWIGDERVWLLKVDVEGNEIDVLRGAKKALSNVQYLHIELNPDCWSMSDLFSLFMEYEVSAELIAIRNFDYPSDGSLRGGDALFSLSSTKQKSNRIPRDVNDDE